MGGKILSWAPSCAHHMLMSCHATPRILFRDTRNVFAFLDGIKKLVSLTFGSKTQGLCYFILISGTKKYMVSGLNSSHRVVAQFNPFNYSAGIIHGLSSATALRPNSTLTVVEDGRHESATNVKQNRS